jgi:hypothetical protein
MSFGVMRSVLFDYSLAAEFRKGPIPYSTEEYCMCQGTGRLPIPWIKGGRVTRAH